MTKPTPAQLQEAVANLVALDQPEDLTAADKPKTEALDRELKALGVEVDISAKDRDAAWAAYQENEGGQIGLEWSILSPLFYSGKRLEVGETSDLAALSGDEVESLVDAGRIKAAA